MICLFTAVSLLNCIEQDISYNDYLNVYSCVVGVSPGLSVRNMITQIIMVGVCEVTNCIEK